MDRIQCPECQTTYTFSRSGIHPPNDAATVVQCVTICAVCKVKFQSTIRWREMEARTRNWLVRVMSWRQKTAPVFEVEVKARRV